LPRDEFKNTLYAITETIELGVHRLQGTAAGNERNTAEDDPATRRFWRTLLSKSVRITAKQRLRVFEALDELGVLPRCTCRKDDPHLALVEEEDLRRAYIIRLVGRRHYRAALAIARFPETFYAVRDAVDAKVAAADAAES
jgi:hypothetical protein